MTDDIDIEKFRQLAVRVDRYSGQLQRLLKSEIETKSIEDTVTSTLANLTSGCRSLVIYGEPQSGKTEMMICLTAKLLDSGYTCIVHLLNDSIDLLGQNLKRFLASGLAPAPTVYSAELNSGPGELVIFCKKNARDLDKMNRSLAGTKVIVIDDEADYATPNAKINRGNVTKINSLIRDLLGTSGIYIGVTATPARLDLNNTFENETEQWVRFRPHSRYTGQDIFFPARLAGHRHFRLVHDVAIRPALIRFIVAVGVLNTRSETAEDNWSMLLHTSGKKDDHATDLNTIRQEISHLTDWSGDGFEETVRDIYSTCKTLYPGADPGSITEYAVRNISRTSLVLFNSDRDRKALGDDAAKPTSPFTFIVGGNIVSRGVTFPNLLSMFFTRNVQNKLQQDTYIQRARMFGNRGSYLEHFELTIPAALYEDWVRCFIFHRLALDSIEAQLGAPTWTGDSRVSVASSPSIDRTTVDVAKGEIGFQMFEYQPDIERIITGNAPPLERLLELQATIGHAAIPQFLLNFISTMNHIGGLALHSSYNISRMSSADQAQIRRGKGFMGTTQLGKGRFPGAVHHIRIHYNAQLKARVFYKYTPGASFTRNTRANSV